MSTYKGFIACVADIEFSIWVSGDKSDSGDKLDFLKVLCFFPGWLCQETSSLTRSLRDLMR